VPGKVNASDLSPELLAKLGIIILEDFNERECNENKHE